MSSTTYSLKARYVFPVAGEPIADGVVTFDRQRIISVGRPVGNDTDIEDLGNVAILPGLVNAHAHLEFSHLSRPIGRRGMALGDWIVRLISELRIECRPPADAVRRGLLESSVAGTTALGEIAQRDWSPDDFQAAPIDSTIFLELISPIDDGVDDVLKLAHRHIASAHPQQKDRRWRPGLCPHSPYSVHPRLLSESAAISARHKVPLSFHLAESPEEIEFLQTASGVFRDMLERLGQWDPTAHRPGRRPFDMLRILAPAHRLLIVHGNYLAAEEIAFIARHAQTMSVVYCPRTHHYFRHAPHPLEKLLSSGINVALGTDSRASSPDLNLLSDMRHVAHCHPAVALKTVLRMGTLGGAKALGREDELGTLEPGRRANLCVVPLPDRREADPHSLLFDQNAAACSTWFGGRQVYPQTP
ncbi:MAG: amidohydrolase family protein [Planctomycetota bacterium]|nr:amidohydrolase family protein [Planctomycetota bacterium]